MISNFKVKLKIFVQLWRTSMGMSKAVWSLCTMNFAPKHVDHNSVPKHGGGEGKRDNARMGNIEGDQLIV
jgi:hypothetical protein